MKLFWNRCLPVLLAALAAAPTSALAQRLLWAPASGRFASPTGWRQPGLLAPGPSTTGEVVVRFRSEVSDQRRGELVSSFGCRVARTNPASGYALVQVRDDRAADLINVLAGRPEVLHAEPCYRLHTMARSLYNPYEWYLFDRGKASARVISKFGIQAASAWNQTKGAGITVAVVDSGVAYEDYNDFRQAPALAEVQFAPGYDFINDTDHPNDDANHGTFVAGVLASHMVNGGGVTGVVPDVTIMPVKVMSADGSGRDYDTAQGIRWAVDHGATVINLSLGGPQAGSVLSDAVKYAAGKDCVLVAAAGNESASQVSYPAAFPDCIAVGATGFDGTRAPYSNRGRGLNVVAPGGNLDQDLNHDGAPDGLVAQTFDPQQGFGSFDYIFFDGTSGASPLVAGVAAMVRAANTDMSADDVRAAIQSTAMHLGTAGRNADYGYGLVDALAAVQAALAQKSSGG